MTAAYFSQARPLARWALGWGNVRGSVKTSPLLAVLRDLGAHPPAQQRGDTQNPATSTRIKPHQVRGGKMCVPVGVRVSPLPPRPRLQVRGRTRGKRGGGSRVGTCPRDATAPSATGRPRGVAAANGNQGGTVSGIKGGLGWGGGRGTEGGVGEK